MNTVESTLRNAGAGAGTLNLLGAVAAGAALMYFLDPERGNRRRKLVRDRATHAAHKSADFMGTAARDTANRARGVAAETSAAVRRERPDDDVLEERVRAELGRAVSHPGAIEVHASDGLVTLQGPVLAREYDALVDHVQKVRGVQSVEDQLQVHETAGTIPALQGEGRRRNGRFELAQENWSPAARVLTGLAGASLASYGARSRGVIGSIAGMAGVALLARATANLELDRLIGVGGGREAVAIQKTINIAAPIDDVFAYFTDWERFPEWMSHVRSVTASGPRGALGAQTRWTVDGPAGTKVSWDAETTAFEDNRLVSWRSVQGEAIRQSGTLRFDENEDGTTRVDIQMTYNPPGGAAGHAIAKLFRRDPRQQMNADLARLKTTIESGIAPHDAAAAS